jgi:hypothetical protein
VVICVPGTVHTEAVFTATGISNYNLVINSTTGVISGKPNKAAAQQFAFTQASLPVNVTCSFANMQQSVVLSLAIKYLQFNGNIATLKPISGVLFTYSLMDMGSGIGFSNPSGGNLTWQIYNTAVPTGF